MEATIIPGAGNKFLFTDLTKRGYKPHSVEEFYMFDFSKPQFYVDISEEITKKLEAFSCHKS
jgi:hypothetical protein